MKIHHSLTSLMTILLVGLTAAKAQSTAPSYKQALDIAKSGNQDVCYYLYGSNWNRLSLSIKKQIWDSGELFSAVGDGVVFTSVDHIDGVHPKVAKTTLPDGFKKMPPMSKITSVTMPGTSYAKLDDQSWGMNIKKKPRRATATIKLKTGSSPSKGVFVSILKDKRDPQATYSLSGLRLKIGDHALKISAASSNTSMGYLLLAFDGTGGYKSYIQQKASDMHVFIMPETPIPPNTELSVEVDFKGKPWCQMGTRLAVRTLSVNARGYQNFIEETKRVFAFYKIISENRGLPATTRNYPAIIFADSKGRFISKMEGLRKSDSTADIAAFIKLSKGKRVARDAAWAAAEKATGEKRAEGLARGLSAIGCSARSTKGAWATYASVFDEIKKIKLPDDHPIHTRYFYSYKAADQVVKGMLATGNEARALATIDSELTKTLSASMRETLMMKQYSICRNSKSESVKKRQWHYLRQLAKEFPGTRRGIGARGLSVWKGDEGPVTFSYGWKPRHLKSGQNVWEINLDTAKAFYTAEPHDIEITLDKNSKNGITIISIEVLDGTHVLASLNPNAELTKESPSYKGRVDLSRWLKKNPKDHLTVICKVSPIGGTQSSGKLKATPQLAPPPAENW